LDFSVLNRGEKIAGVAGILLILIMFIFDWFGPKGATDLGGTNAWQSYGFIDIVLFVTALTAIALALSAASDSELGLPVALSAIVTGLGIIAVILVVISIISPPDYDVVGPVGVVGGSIEASVKIGVILGLLATIGVTAGGFLAMQEEGTSFAGEADRFRGGGPGTGAPGAGGPGAGPPAPPPPSSSPPPPPSSPPPGSNPPPSSGP
jgi:hypothetical protein